MNTTKTTASTLETDWSVKLPLAAAALVLALLVIPHSGHAQGVVRGMEGGAHHGAREGGRAAGPVGAVVGGAVGAGVGGAVGAVNGVLGIDGYRHPRYYRHHHYH
jgi:ribose/xylose/arabinose/galactoside ABC-type transport system permease subunit